jgi:hypothetical protein
LRGLILAETDFDEEEAMDDFPPPPFAFADVTRDVLFTGGTLVGLTAEDLREEMKRRSGEPESVSQKAPHSEG